MSWRSYRKKNQGSLRILLRWYRSWCCDRSGVTDNDFLLFCRHKEKDLSVFVTLSTHLAIRTPLMLNSDWFCVLRGPPHLFRRSRRRGGALAYRDAYVYRMILCVSVGCTAAWHGERSGFLEHSRRVRVSTTLPATGTGMRCVNVSIRPERESRLRLACQNRNPSGIKHARIAPYRVLERSPAFHSTGPSHGFLPLRLKPISKMSSWILAGVRKLGCHRVIMQIIARIW